MSLHYINAKKKVGFGTEKTEATVETVRRGDTASSQTLVSQIALNTGLPAGTINNVLGALVDSLAPFFKMGHGAYIGRSGKEEDGLGIVRPKLIRTKKKVAKVDDEGNETGEYDTKVSLSVGVSFLPSTAFKEMMAEVSVKDVTDSDDTDSDDTDDEDDDSDDSGNSGGGASTPSTDFGE